MASSSAPAARLPAPLVPPQLWPSRWPWWVQVLVVHTLARAVSAGVLLVVARAQAANPWTGRSPSYLQYTGLMWDASWYRTIAENGYPAELPRGLDGAVQQNAWAFFPLFPGLGRAVMNATGAPWEVVAPVLATLLGAAAMLVVHQVVVAGLRTARPARSPRLPAPTLPAPTLPAPALLMPTLSTPAGWEATLPLATVAVLGTFASSPVLQVAYTESLALLLLAVVLWCVVRRHYVVALPAVVALGFTRAVALPVTVAVAAHALGRLRDARDGEPWPRPDKVRLALLGVVALASGLVWPAICGWVTGEPDAYAQTQATWRARGEVVPLVPWLDVARWLFGGWGPLVLAAAVALAVLAVAGRPMRRLGPVLQGWTAGYLGYLLLVLEPGTSLVRFLLLAFSLAAVVAQLALRSRAPRSALLLVLILGVVGQAWWVWSLWRLVPPSGWPP